MLNEQHVILALNLSALGFKENICEKNYTLYSTEFGLIDELLNESADICKQIISLKDNEQKRFKEQLSKFLDTLDSNMNTLIDSAERAQEVAIAIIRVEDYINGKPLDCTNRLIRSNLQILKLREKHNILGVKFNNIKIDKRDKEIINNVEIIGCLMGELIKAYGVIRELRKSGDKE